MLQETLAQANAAQFELVHEDRLAAGLKHLARGGIDVILLDLSLPDGQGLDSLTRVHERVPDVPILVLTGLDDERLGVQAVQAGAQDYLVKGGVDGHSLVRAMHCAIWRQRMRTQLEQKTRELQASETRLRSTTENNADSIIVVDRRGMVRFVNPAAEDLFGRQAEDLVGELLGFPVAGGETTEVEIIRRGGETAVIEMRVVETEWEGEPVYLASLRDVTKRKRAEEQLRRSEEHYRSALDNMLEGCQIIGYDWRYLYVNDAVARQGRRAREELPGHTMMEMYPGIEDTEMFAALRRCMEKRTPHHMQNEFIFPDGSKGWFELSIQPVPEGIFILSLDITEQHRAEEEIHRRVVYLEVLNAIIAAAAAATDLPALLETVLDHTLRALGLKMGAIWLADQHILRGLSPESGPALAQAATAAGLDFHGPIAVEDWQLVRSEARSESGVPSDGTPLRCMPDYEPTSEAETLRRLMARFGIQASLTVPITSAGPSTRLGTGLSPALELSEGTGPDEGRRIGGLSLAVPEPRPWSAEEIALVEAVGRQLGGTAERLRLFQETQAHAERMVRLASVSEFLNRPLGVEAVVAAIGQGTLALSGTGRATLYLRHPDDTITCPWSQGLSPAYLAQVTARVREMPGGRLLESPEPVLIPDVENLPEKSPLQGLARAEGYRAAGLWPLIYEGRVVAAVGGYYDAPHTWSVAEQEVTEAFCRQAAVALENARLFEIEQARRQELDALYGLSRQLVVTDALETVLNTVTRHAVETVHATFCRILLLEEDGAFVCRSAHPVRVLERDLGVGRPDPEPAWPHYRRALAQAELLMLLQDTPDLSAAERRFLLLDLAYSLCLAPLRVGDEAIGLLVLGETRSATREPFDADKLRLVTSIADQAASAIHRARLHAQTEQRLRRLTTLRNIDQAITASTDLQLVLDVLLNQITAQPGVDAAAVLLLNRKTQTLEYTAGRGFRSDAITRSRVGLGDELAGHVALGQRTVEIRDWRLEAADNLQPFSYAQDRSLISNLQSEGFVAYCGVPLIAKGEVKGILEIFHRTPLDPDPEWLDFLEMLAGQAAIAIDNAELFDNLQRSNVDLTLAYDTTLEGWARALELRDRETEGHTRRVNELTLRLARAMGMSDEELAHVRRGALLHDIGKMGIPNSILLKPGELSDEEWEVMRQHPVYACELLSPIAFLGPALDIPYCHHERWDGAGYPRRLKGEQIPLAARIFAVVDVWDALRSDHPYRPAWPEEKVLEHIREQAGKHFDPQVVETFFELLEHSYAGS